jgi:hypothetical protein
MRNTTTVLAIGLSLAWTSAIWAAGGTTIIEKNGVTAGLAVVVGATDGVLEAELTNRSRAATSPRTSNVRCQPEEKETKYDR